MARARISQLNLLLGVDKPAGMTSHDVVARVRRAVGERRVGHAGTLDPMATGVMIVGIGQATRLLGLLTLDTKSYTAQITFGAETTTDDAEGEVSREAPVPERLFDEPLARDALARLVGEQLQVPPAYSAISVQGVRAYRRARAGEEVALEPRRIEVFEARLLDVDAAASTWRVAFKVSKGTYIRALARDLGRSVGSAAHLSGLQRTASGGVGLSRCIELDDVTPETARVHAIDPVTALQLPRVRVAEGLRPDILCGKRLDAPEGARGAVAVIVGGELQAIATASGGRLIMNHVFPQGIEGVGL